MYYPSEFTPSSTVFQQPIAEQIWQAKYQYKTAARDVDYSVHDTWLRVARALAKAERPQDRPGVEKLFYNAMDEFKLLPAGRILSGAGTARDVTLSNTFVMKSLPDSVDGMMDVFKEAALTMKMGGGLGFDFSTLRPKGTLVKGLDCPAAGPLAAMDICDAICRMLVTGMGRGAMMATMRVDHPDIEDFITAKSDPTRMRNFNLSVLISDAFMAAVEADADWQLVWDGAPVRSLKARALWQTIMRQNFDAAEPGVLFVDRINAKNPLNYLETISATNSCAEQPLPPNGTCPLSSINLAKLVRDPFTPAARMDLEELKRLTSVAVHLLDDTLDVSRYAVEEQRIEAQTKRRIGLGVTGLADALIMLGVPYGSDASVALVDTWMRSLSNAAYLASAELARTRGAFAAYDAKMHMAQDCIRQLDPDVRAAIKAHGLRNATLTTVAPTGTTSMLGGNVSSGIEPIFSTSYTRKITEADGSISSQVIEDYAVALYHRIHGRDAPLTEAFVTVSQLAPADHLRIQAAAQTWIDSGISKTVNCPEDIAFDDFADIYREAYATGCKGCTTYRPNAVTGSVLSA
ncbi:ribonucleoside-diphosphate reductase class II [Litoreibacter ponti]|uniref:Vitamin B12-dependent ribonucleotide reductase n=1 Tax=Litoreibacter ponti TaxID=1510457 RepID=A0A2T6BJU0_9RHOB|nr:adenosylcobalamin-dependent ribonucleoside-diphosphate reductase [Litoreibacter ponti]PTX56324.1 ribonucleoside-diphosphate reductase class II [Litoreibacter ponti]